MDKPVTFPTLAEIEEATGHLYAVQFEMLSRIADCLRAGYEPLSREDREQALQLAQVSWSQRVRTRNVAEARRLLHLSEAK